MSEKKSSKGMAKDSPAPAEMRVPILPGTAATDYERYLRTDDLLSLQKPEGERLHDDELTFQVVHQSSELLMKAAVWELERARRLIEQDEYPRAVKLMQRAGMELDHVVELLKVLETLTPYEYHVIRAGLGHGSGLDSPGFLALLHLAPRLGDVMQAKLKAAGLTVEELYRHHQEFFGMHEAAEQLLDFDERIQLFRFLHLKLAQRIIGGGVIGTMGTPVEVLHQRSQHIFYKELWDVRNQITDRVNRQRQTESTGHGEEPR